MVNSRFSMRRSFSSGLLFIFTLAYITYVAAEVSIQSGVTDQAGVNYKPTTSETDSLNAQIKIGVMLSNTTDDGYSYIHAVALANLVRQLQTNNISVLHELYIQADDNTTLATMRDWRRRNFTVIFSTSGSLTSVTQSYMLEDNVTKIATWGSVVPDYRAEAFDNRAWEAMYLAGMACGLATKSSNIGYIGISITRSTVRNLNAFYLGARSVRPLIQVHATFTNVLFDPLLESRSAQYMIDTNQIDCAIGTVDSLRTFENNSLPSIGFNSDARYSVGQQVWASVFNDWNAIYVDILNRIMNGTYGNAKKNLCDLGACCDLGPFSPVVPLDIQQRLIATRADILAGRLKLFCGADANKLGFNVSATTCLTDSQIKSMSTFHPRILNERNVSYADIYDYIFVEANEPVAIALHVVTAMCLALLVIFVILVGVFWHTKIIRYGSPPFLLTMCVADGLGLLSIYAWTGQPTYLSCQMRVWLIGLAVPISIGALIVKNIRIWLIFRNISYGVFAIKTYKLFLGMGVIVLWNVIILVAWTAADPFMPVNASSALIEPWQFYQRCGSQSLAGPLVFVISQALFVVFLCFIASKTSKVGRDLENSQKSTIRAPSPKNSDELLAYYFDESNQIYTISFTILLLGFLLIGVIVGTPYTPHTEVFAFALYFIVSFTGLLLCIIGIKIYRIVVRNQRDAASKSSQTTTGISTHHSHVSTSNSTLSQNDTTAADRGEDD